MRGSCWHDGYRETRAERQQAIAAGCLGWQAVIATRRVRQGTGLTDPDVLAIRIGDGSLVSRVGSPRDFRLGSLVHSRLLNGPW